MGVMLLLRSLVFNILFYANLILALLIGFPALFMHRQAVYGIARYWRRSSLWLARVICGMKVEYRGEANIPKGAVIIAPKHQSIWETFALVDHFEDFSFVLKRELTLIPFFGWYLKAAKQVAIDRKAGRSAMNQVVAAARTLMAEGRQLFIFPEGTRRPVGAPPLYRFGVAQVYEETGAPCLPVALNSGLFWARRSFLRRPGTIVVEFLPVIAPGLNKQDFLKVLSERIETATNRLVDEAVAKDPALEALRFPHEKTA